MTSPNKYIPRHRRTGRNRSRNPLPSSRTFQNPNPLENFSSLRITEPETNSSGINFDAYEDIPVESTGVNVPPPVTTFSEIDLGEALAENIKRCKYVKPTPIQRHAIPIALAGRDLMACAQTGSGKTAAFCFPIISGLSGNGWAQIGSARRWGMDRLACPSALILSPTRELSLQIHEEAKKFAYNTGLKIVVAYGGAPIVHQFRNLEKGVDILVATPGRLVDMIERGRVSLRRIKYLAIDEADRMLDMGFEPQVRQIVQETGMPPSGQRQTMLFSATFPHEIQRLASDFLLDYIFLTVGRVGSSTDLIVQKVDHVEDMQKRTHLVDILLSQKVNGAFGSNGKKVLTLIFVETKKGADSLEYWLSSKGFPAAAIHGDKMQHERERALRSFKSCATPILVATDVASRGLDIPNVFHVINFDLPKHIDDYVHRIGRTGRAGKSGLATAFFNSKNMQLAKPLVELMKEANQEVPSWLKDYAESSLYGGSSGRLRRNSGRNFGGYDYRNDSKAGNEHYFSTYAGADSFMDSNASFSDGFDYSSATTNSGYVVPTGSGDFAAPFNDASYNVHAGGDHDPPVDAAAAFATSPTEVATGSDSWDWN